jgi:hypothetical protein
MRRGKNSANVRCHHAFGNWEERPPQAPYSAAIHERELQTIATIHGMRDVLRLRAKLHQVLFLAPLALPAVATLGACAKDDPAKTANVNIPPTGSVAPLAVTSASGAVPDAVDPEQASAQDGGPRILLRNPGMIPRCPSGAFCTTKAKAATFADTSSKKQLDCPVTMAERERPDATEGMPRMRYARFAFDEQTTQSTRADAGASDSCCYTWFIPCPGGRPLIANEQPIVASPRAGNDWSRKEHAIPQHLAAEERERAREAWLRDALSEHAAIASFARTTLELLAVGAPPDLVMDSQRAGMDEVRHAERCFEMVRAYGGAGVSPGPLPMTLPREASVARLARDTFIEGCVGETVSALAATRAADECSGAARSTWNMLASDETRHAALAWRTLAWALREGGPSVGGEVLALAERMQRELLAEAEAQANTPDADVVTHGRLSRRALSAVHRDAWRELILPTLRALV